MSASGEGWPGPEGATSAKALWSELTWPRQNSEAWKTMDHGASFLEPGFSLPCGFLWHPGVSRFCRHAADQDDPGGEAAHRWEGRGQVWPLLPRHPASTFPGAAARPPLLLTNHGCLMKYLVP